MASDSLNEVGRFIGRTRKTADRSLKRAYPVQPRLERIRDIFDSDIDFEMSFNLDDQDERVMLDLFFQLPPPAGGCKAGCIFTNCESFNVTAGNHAVTLAHPYLAGSVSVYINNTKLSDSQISETNPEGGEVFFQGGQADYTVDICYVYLDCPDFTGSLCPYDLGPSFAGALLVFSDRFDRATSLETTGGLGYWYLQSFGAITIPVLTRPQGGYLFTGNSGGANYTFEDLRAGGVTEEVLLAVDFSVNGYSQAFNYVFSADGMNSEAQFTISPTTNTVELAKPFRYRDTRLLTNDWAIANQTQTLPIPFPPEALRTKVFIRFFQTVGILQFKIWPMDQPEPTTWLQHTAGITPVSGTDTQNWVFEYIENDIIGGRMSGSNYILAVQHWAGQNSGVYGRWRHETTEPLPGYSWHSTTPAPQSSYDYVAAHPQNEPFLGFGDFGTSPTLTQFQQSGRLETVYPNNQYNYVTGFFGPGGPDDIRQNILNGTDHYAISYDTTIGKPTAYRISGVLKWYMTSATANIIPHLTIELQAMSYGDQTPNVTGDWIQGDIKQTIFMPMSPADTVELVGANPLGGSGWRSASAWTPFEIEVPCTGTHVQWGVRFLETPEQVESMLGTLAVDSILRSTTLQIQFDNVYTEAVMAPLGPAKDICLPGSTLSDRCTQIIESFSNPFLIDFNTIADNGSNTTSFNTYTTTYTGDSGPWDIILSNPMISKIDIGNNILRSEFKARGITLDGSDGRAPRETSNTNLIFATTSNTGTAGLNVSTFNAPVGCGDHTISLKFRYGGSVNSWTTNNGGTNFPTLRFGVASNTNESGSIGFVVSKSAFGTRIDGSLGLLNPFFTTLTENTWYNAYGEMTSTEGRWKFWQVGTSEPTSWQLAYPRVAQVNNSFTIYTTYTTFINDGTYVEFTDLRVLSLEASI